MALSLMSLNAQAQVYNYDVNNDGEVNVVDVTLIVDKILGKESLLLPITFSADQKPFEWPDGPAYNRRKTQETTIATLKEFYVNYTYDKYPGHGIYSAPELKTYWAVDEGTGQGRWLVGNGTTPGNGYWPSGADASVDVTFYAYANVDIDNPSSDYNAMFFCEGNTGQTSNGDVSKPYIHFILDENGPATKDLLVAKQEDNWNNCEGHIFFHFEHACAAAQFFLVKTQKLENVSVQVKKAVLYNVMNDGNYFFNSDMEGNGYWDGVKHRYSDDRAYYTLWDGSGNYRAVPANTDKTSEMWQLTSSTSPESDYYFFIPQEFTPWDKSPISTNTSGSYIELECQITDGSKSFIDKAYIPFTTTNTLQSGYAYPIIVKIGTGLLDANGQKIFNSNGTIN